MCFIPFELHIKLTDVESRSPKCWIYCVDEFVHVRSRQSDAQKKKTRQSTQTQHDSVYLSMWTSKWLKLRWEQVGPMSDDI